MKSIRRLAASGAVVVLVAACGGGGDKPGAERVQQLTSDLSIQQVGWASVAPEQAWVRYVKGSAWETATHAGGKSSVQRAETSDFGWKPAPVADLKVAELDKQIAAKGDTCTGEVGMTAGGATLSQVTCDGDVVSTAVDGKELTEIKQWDAAGIDQALGELKQVQDPQSLTLTFLTPKSGVAKGQTSLRDIGPKVKGVSGAECMVTVTRLGAADGNQGLLNWGGCDAAEPLGTEPFALADVTGAKLDAALKQASTTMGITTTDVGQFDVYVQQGKPVVQVRAGNGVPTKTPTVTVPLG